MFKYILIVTVMSTLQGCMAPSAVDQIAADAYVKLSLALASQGYVKDAKEKLLVAERLAPNNTVVWWGKGLYHEKVGELEMAQLAYETALRLTPSNGVALNYYGNFLMRQKKYQLAQPYFLAALQDPTFLDSARAYQDAGICALNMGQKHLARGYFIKALGYDHNLELPKY